jgi:hypothetical protein
MQCSSTKKPGLMPTRQLENRTSGCGSLSPLIEGDALRVKCVRQCLVVCCHCAIVAPPHSELWVLAKGQSEPFPTTGPES